MIATTEQAQVEKLVNMALETVFDSDPGRKFELAEVTPELQAVAAVYAAYYAGTFDYMVQMRKAATQFGKLTVPQAKGVLNCMRAELAFRAKNAAKVVAPAAPETAVAVQQEPQMQGTFTLILDAETDDRITLRLKNMDPEQLAKYNRPAGSQVLEYLAGPDNETQYRGYAFVTGRDARVWKKFQDNPRLEIATQLLMDADTETLKAAGYEWALVSGRCWMCGHKLTVPASICAGVGPVCADKL